MKELRILVSQNLTMCEIGQELGRSVQSVQQKVRRLKLCRGRNGRPPDLDRICRIIDLIEKTGTIYHTARMLGLCYQPVHRTVKRLVAGGVLKRVGGKTSHGYFTTTRKWKGA